MKSSNNIYYLPPKLANAHYDMTLLGLKLRAIALSKISPLAYLLGYAPPITISAREWQELIISEQPYRDLKRALESFGNAVVQFEDNEKKYKFLKYYEYLEGEGKVLLEFCPEFLLACR